MEYVYSALLLHKAGSQINEENMKKVLTAAGVKVDDSRVKALVAALKGVDIDAAIGKAAPAISATAAPTAGAPAAAGKKESKKEEPEVSEAEAAAGLGSLFG